MAVTLPFMHRVGSEPESFLAQSKATYRYDFFGDRETVGQPASVRVANIKYGYYHGYGYVDTYQLKLHHVMTPDGNAVPNLLLGTVNNGQPQKWSSKTKNGRTMDDAVKVLNQKLNQIYPSHAKSDGRNSNITKVTMPGEYAVNQQLQQVNFLIQMPDKSSKLLIVTNQHHIITQSAKTKIEIVKLK